MDRWKGNDDTSEQVWDIFKAFDWATAHSSCEEVEHEQLQVHAASLKSSRERLQLWAGGLGAFHVSSDQRSLQYRLRNAPQVEGRVRELLTVLEKNLKDFTRDTQKTAKTTVDQHGVVTSDEKAQLSEILGFADEEEMGCGVSVLCETVSQNISRLIKICMLIGRSTARDRYARAEASGGGTFDGTHDVRHVMEKFGHECEQVWLLERLGKMITKRRQYLKYVREHRSRIAHIDARPTRTTVEPLANDAPERPSSVSFSQQSPGTVASLSVTRPSLMPTTASTMRLSPHFQIDEFPEDDRSSTTTMTSVAYETFEDQIPVPILSSIAQPNQPFPCPYCPTVQAFRNQSSWKRHVYADLRAYVCTSKDCSMTSFEDKASWIAHEMENHRRCWNCHECTFETRGLPHLTKHIRQTHGTVLSEQDIDLLPLISSRPLSHIDLDQCQLCGWTGSHRQEGPVVLDSRKVPYERLMAHLANHQEQLALFAIPRGELGTDSESAEDGSFGSSDARRGSQGSSRQLSDNHAEQIPAIYVTEAEGDRDVVASINPGMMQDDPDPPKLQPLRRSRTLLEQSGDERRQEKPATREGFVDRMRKRFVDKDFTPALEQTQRVPVDGSKAPQGKAPQAGSTPEGLPVFMITDDNTSGPLEPPSFSEEED